MKIEISQLDQTSDAYKAIIANLAANHGLVSRKQQETTIMQIAAAIPPSVEATLGATTEEKIQNFVDTFMNSNGGGNPNPGGNGGNNPTDITPGVTKAKNARVPAQDYVAPTGPGTSEDLAELIANDFATRQNNSDNSAIIKLLTKVPDLTSYMEGKTVVPFMKDKTVEQHKANLVNTPENKEAFDKFLDARTNNKPIPVSYNNKNSRVDGVVVTVPSSETGATGTAERVMSNSELNAYLISETNLRIGTAASPISVGAHIKRFSVVDNKGRAANGADGYGKPYMAYVGKKLALDTDPTCLQVITEQDAATATIKKRVGTDLTFKVYDGEADPSTGNRKEKTVRVSGVLEDFPNYVVSEQYKANFPNKQTNVISSELTAEEAATTKAMLVNIAHAISAGKLSGVSSANLKADFVAKINSVAKDGAQKDAKAADAALAGAK